MSNLHTGIAVPTKTECPLKESLTIPNLTVFCKASREGEQQQMSGHYSSRSHDTEKKQKTMILVSMIDAETNIEVTRFPLQIIPVHLSPHGSFPFQFDGLFLSQLAAIPLRPKAAQIDNVRNKMSKLALQSQRLEEKTETYCLADLYRPKWKTPAQEH